MGKDVYIEQTSNPKKYSIDNQFFSSLDSIVKPKENNKTNGTSSKSNNNVISILKSDTISVLKPDDHLDDFFADTNKNSNNESSVQLNTDDLNRIAENTVR
jgi:hypothetical protein